MNIKPRIDAAFDSHLALCQIVQRENPSYNWVGFYWMDSEARMLDLGAYVGASTDHTRIPFGKGICGQVAESGEMFVVPDVNDQENYLACSMETQSEIVVPIYKDGVLIGQLDIDSHTKDAFGPKDQVKLEALCRAVAEAL